MLSPTLKVHVFILLLAALILSPACKEKASPAKTSEKASPAQAQRQAQNAKQEAKTDQKEEEEPEKQQWIYDPADKWDPFVTPEPPTESMVEPVERYDLDQMLLLGVISGGGMDGAFIRFPDGSDRIIRKGDLLGRHRGVVTEITKGYIIVEERYLSPDRPNETFVIEKMLEMPEIEKRRR